MPWPTKDKKDTGGEVFAGIVFFEKRPASAGPLVYLAINSCDGSAYLWPGLRLTASRARDCETTHHVKIQYIS